MVSVQKISLPLQVQQYVDDLLEHVDRIECIFRPKPIIDSDVILSENVLITGPTGCGKTYVACALGEQACQQHIQVVYYRLTRLLDDLNIEHADGSYQKQLLQLSKKELQILDDWVLEKLNTRQSSDLLEVMEERYQRGILRRRFSSSSSFRRATIEVSVQREPSGHNLMHPTKWCTPNSGGNQSVRYEEKCDFRQA